MSSKKKIKKLKKQLKQLRQILKKDCLTITNSENENEQVTLSFIDGIFRFSKTIKSEQTDTTEISEVTFNYGKTDI
ncbi:MULTISPECIES: hypothetical protein [Flavobacterium]|uniref:Uncharacterized protein n=2 Tax=Flavobacterium TaxID=237 RepID=A0A6V6Z0M4_9FLAO|nr:MULTISPECIES: hypothetical protein [Flavobacterium]CAD0004482.1 hypothetical protein FLACHUCJ7_01883 [Flavobacterium chungangense]CAD0007578.1 hypothetical protein FLAT13_03909 [Flavobacterium salmonis]